MLLLLIYSSLFVVVFVLTNSELMGLSDTLRLCNELNQSLMYVWRLGTCVDKYGMELHDFKICLG